MPTHAIVIVRAPIRQASSREGHQAYLPAGDVPVELVEIDGLPCFVGRADMVDGVGEHAGSRDVVWPAIDLLNGRHGQIQLRRISGDALRSLEQSFRERVRQLRSRIELDDADPLAFPAILAIEARSIADTASAFSKLSLLVGDDSLARQEPQAVEAA